MFPAAAVDTKGKGRESERARRPKKQKTSPFWLGGVAASGAAICTHPLDVAKVRLQTGSSRGMLGTLVNAIRHDGIRRGAYVGLSASIMRQMTYSVTRFGVYDVLKRGLVKRKGGDLTALGVGQMAAAASLAGAAGGIAGNPADIILVRMTGDINRPAAERKGYKNCIDGLVRMIREEGSGSLFRGLVPNVSRAVLMNASQLTTYDTIKVSLLRTKLFREGLWLHFCASSIAGAVATTICSPFDVLKSRIMNQGGQGSSAAIIIRDSYKNEGVRWLFRGWTPAFIRLGPNTVLIFVGLEQLKLVWDRIVCQ